jgi:hypothetical protein
MKMMSKRFALLALVAVLPAACSEVNPTGPSTSFGAPVAGGPANGTQYRFNEQPITLTITNVARTNASATVTYTVEVAANSNFSPVAQTKTGVAESSTGTTTVTFTGLTGNTTYFWRWKAVIDGVTGQPSPSASFFVRPQVVLGTPEPEQPAASSDVYDPRPTFTVRNGSRTGPVGAITYEFQVSTSAAFATIVASRTGVAEASTRTSWQPAADLPEGTLFWRARAVDATNDERSSYTNGITFNRKQGIDLTKVVYHVGPPIYQFEETAVITDAYHTASELCIFHTRLGLWPATDFFGVGPILEGNQQIFALINGTWHSGSADWYRPGQACKVVDENIGADSFMGTQPLSSWRPRPGEVFGVMATTPARMYPAMKTYDERSNVRLITW